MLDNWYIWIIGFGWLLETWNFTWCVHLATTYNADNSELILLTVLILSLKPGCFRLKDVCYTTSIVHLLTEFVWNELIWQFTVLSCSLMTGFRPHQLSGPTGGRLAHCTQDAALVPWVSVVCALPLLCWLISHIDTVTHIQLSVAPAFIHAMEEGESDRITNQVETPPPLSLLTTIQMCVHLLLCNETTVSYSEP